MKTTYVIRDGQLVEKVRPGPPTIELLAMPAGASDLLECLQDMSRMVSRAFLEQPVTDPSVADRLAPFDNIANVLMHKYIERHGYTPFETVFDREAMSFHMRPAQLYVSRETSAPDAARSGPLTPDPATEKPK